MEEILKQLFLDRSAATLHDAAARNAQFRAQQAQHSAMKADAADAQRVESTFAGRLRAPHAVIGPGDVIQENESSRPKYLNQDLDPAEIADRLTQGETNPEALHGLNPATFGDVASYIPDLMALRQTENSSEALLKQLQDDDWKGLKPGQIPKLYKGTGDIITEGDAADNEQRIQGDKLRFGHGPEFKPMFKTKGGTMDQLYPGQDVPSEDPGLKPMDPNDLPFSVRMFSPRSI